MKVLKSLDEWEIKNLSDRVVLKKKEVPFLLPKIEIIVDDSLGFTVKVFGCYLPEDYSVYVEYRHTVKKRGRMETCETGRRIQAL